MSFDIEKEGPALQAMTDDQLMGLYGQLETWIEQYSLPLQAANARMDYISEVMLQRLKDRNNKSLTTGGYTLTRGTKTVYNVNKENWKPYWNFILVTASQYQKTNRDPLEAFSFLNKAPNEAAIKAYVEEFKTLPPGVKTEDVEKKLSIKKA